MQAISKRLFDHTTLTYSNVMGPDEEISIFDHPISYLAASALTGSQVSIDRYIIMPYFYVTFCYMKIIRDF